VEYYSAQNSAPDDDPNNIYIVTTLEDPTDQNGVIITCYLREGAE
jgi:hypothetical protein